MANKIGRKMQDSLQALKFEDGRESMVFHSIPPLNTKEFKILW